VNLTITTCPIFQALSTNQIAFIYLATFAGPGYVGSWRDDSFSIAIERLLNTYLMSL